MSMQILGGIVTCRKHCINTQWTTTAARMSSCGDGIVLQSLKIPRNVDCRCGAAPSTCACSRRQRQATRGSRKQAGCGRSSWSSWAQHEASAGYLRIRMPDVVMRARWQAAQRCCLAVVWCFGSHVMGQLFWIMQDVVGKALHTGY